MGAVIVPVTGIIPEFEFNAPLVFFRLTVKGSFMNFAQMSRIKDRVGIGQVIAQQSLDNFPVDPFRINLEPRQLPMQGNRVKPVAVAHRPIIGELHTAPRFCGVALNQLVVMYGYFRLDPLQIAFSNQAVFRFHVGKHGMDFIHLLFQNGHVLAI